MLVLGVVLAAGNVSQVFAASVNASDDSHAPNIILLVADDLGYADLSCMRMQDDVATPHIDRLARTGTRFLQAYATSPICNASRAGLVTGCYQQRQGIYWYGGPGIHDTRFPTLAELLQKRGYATGYVGKFHYGGHGVHQPEHRSFPLNHGFQTFFGFSGGRKHYLVHRNEVEQRFQSAKQKHRRKGQSLQMGPMWDGLEPADQEGFSTELFAQHAVDFLERHPSEPFFLMVAFNAVHNFTHQLPQSYLQAKELDSYHDWDPAKEDYYDWYRGGRWPNNPAGRAQYLGQLHFLDKAVGAIVDRVEALDLRRNTIIVFVGDNGGSTPIYAKNGPLRGSKYTLYEGGIRVPLIVSWPGHVLSNVVATPVVSALDLLPTLCAAAGITSKYETDGVDLTKVLRDVRHPLSDRTLFWDTGHESAVRRGAWKLRVALDDRHARYQTVELELGTFLTNLHTDPTERQNLLDAHPKIFQELHAAHSEWKVRMKQSFAASGHRSGR